VHTLILVCQIVINTIYQDMSFRAGWDLKNFHTFFDYWVGSFSASVRSGKVIYGWTSKVQDCYYGGHPAELSAISDVSGKVDEFMENLLGHNEELNPTVKRLLFANGLRFYNDFIRFLKEEPNKKYEGEKVNKHPFVAKMNETMSRTGKFVYL
jgi:hypothetical protein